MNKDKHTQDQLKEAAKLIHRANIKARWYSCTNPHVLLPELLKLAIQTTVVVSVVRLLGGL